MASDIKVYKSITQVAEGCGKSRQWFYDRRRLGQSLPPAEHDGYVVGDQKSSLKRFDFGPSRQLGKDC